MTLLSDERPGAPLPVACAICRRPVLKHDPAINADGVFVHLRCAAYRRRHAAR
jgi:hypothetical protein